MIRSTGGRIIGRPRSVEPVYLPGVPRRVWLEEACAARHELPPAHSDRVVLRYVSSGDGVVRTTADRILDAAASGRKNRTQSNAMFGGHVSGRRIEGTLDRLASEGRITRTMARTPGRSVEWITAVRSAEHAD